MTRSEERTAAAAVAVTLGVGTLAKPLGLGPVPPGLVQLFGPVAGSVGRSILDNARRGLFIFLILLAPWWAGFAVSAASSMPVIDEHMELPGASITILAPAALLLWAVRNVGSGVELTSARRLSEGRDDEHRRWFALSTTHIKSQRGAPWVRQERGARVYNSA